MEVEAKKDLHLPHSEPSSSLPVSPAESGFIDDNSSSVNEGSTSKGGSECGYDTEDKISTEAMDPLGVITKEMIQEEKKLRSETEKQMKKLQLKYKAEEDKKELEQKKYQRLLSLLKKSEFFASFAAKRLKKLKDVEDSKLNKLSRKRKQECTDSENISSPKYMKEGNINADPQRILSEKGLENEIRKDDGEPKKEKEEMLTPDKETIMETRVSSLGITVPASQPSLLTGAALRDYQLEGLNWLKMQFLSGMNGILADEMGLGKTIQVVSLLCHLYEEKVRGPFLIIAPLSTLPNWLHEFETFAPDVPIMLYHGDKKTRLKLRFQINRTHNVLGSPSKPVVITSYEIPLIDKHFLKTISWKYLIVDEGHRLKNYKTLLAKALMQFHSVNRMLLTGTPIQNNLSELWSLLHFLVPEVFDDLDDFHSWFAPEEIEQYQSNDVILQKEKENHVISTLHQILEPFLLRRVKSDVNLKLPGKKEKHIFCPLTTLQYKLYSQTVDKSIVKLTNDYNPDSHGGHIALPPSSVSGSIIEMTAHAESVKKERKACLDDVLVIPDNPDGTKVKRRCTTASFKYKEGSNLDESSKYSTVAYKGSLNNSKHMGGPSDSDESSNNSTTAYEGNLEDKAIPLMEEWNEDDCFKFRLTMSSVMMMLRKISNHPYLVQKLVYPGSNILRVDERIITSSGKMMVLDSLLRRLKQNNHKVLIFSTFTMILDVIESYMEMKDYSFVRLDGNTKIEDRKVNIALFNSDPEIFAFLISTRAGGLGINLAAADTVIIFDSDWNPQVDLQAQDRCHRIGQTKPVIVYRLISSGTIDEKIVSRASAKRKLEKAIIQAGEFKHQRKGRLKLDLESLRELLDKKNHCAEIHSNGSVLTDEQWQYLLDRSN